MTFIEASTAVRVAIGGAGLGVAALAGHITWKKVAGKYIASGEERPMIEYNRDDTE